jgi:hypothetical protein
MSSTYTCAICKGTFDKGLTDAEAAEQYLKEFPLTSRFIPVEQCDLVCRDCFEKLQLGTLEHP